MIIKKYLIFESDEYDDCNRRIWQFFWDKIFSQKSFPGKEYFVGFVSLFSSKILLKMVSLTIITYHTFSVHDSYALPSYCS